MKSFELPVIFLSRSKIFSFNKNCPTTPTPTTIITTNTTYNNNNSLIDGVGNGVNTQLVRWWKLNLLLRQHVSAFFTGSSSGLDMS